MFRLLTSAGRPASARRPYFNWKRKYDGMQPPEMRRLKQLEDENARLKKIAADLLQMCEKPASIRHFIIFSTGGRKDARFSLRTGERRSCRSLIRKSVVWKLVRAQSDLS